MSRLGSQRTRVKFYVLYAKSNDSLSIDSNSVSMSCAIFIIISNGCSTPLREVEHIDHQKCLKNILKIRSLARCAQLYQIYRFISQRYNQQNQIGEIYLARFFFLFLELRNYIHIVFEVLDLVKSQHNVRTALGLPSAPIAILSDEWIEKI